MLNEQPDGAVATVVAVETLEALIDQPVTQLVDHVISMAKPTIDRRSSCSSCRASERRHYAYARPSTARQ